MSDSMRCTYCGRTKQFPDGFPTRHFAQCWDCAWDDHIHTSHPRIVRRIKRLAKKRAKVTNTRQAFDTLFEREKRQLLGVTATEGGEQSGGGCDQCKPRRDNGDEEEGK